MMNVFVSTSTIEDDRLLANIDLDCLRDRRAYQRLELDYARQVERIRKETDKVSFPKL